MNIDPQKTQLLPVIGLALFLFGLGFNWFTSWLHKQNYNDGYTWGLVVIGVAVTVLASGFVIGWTAVLILLICFTCSGLPMAIGDIWRAVRAKRDFISYRSKNADEEAPPMGQ